MLGFNYIKFDSMNYVIHYHNGKIKKEGRGLSFFYFAPKSSIVSIPLESNDFQFNFRETTNDYQEVVLQGQVTYKVAQPKMLSEALDFTVNTSGAYVKKDYEKIQQRIINEAQTSSGAIIQTLNLKDAIRKHEEFEHRIFEDLQSSQTIAMLGLEILSVNILGVSPTPEMSRALETQTREALQKEADEAIYERRNFAVEQERMIKESELNTEIAIEEKQKQIAQKEMETKVVKQENEQRLRAMKVKADFEMEEEKQKLIELQVKNEMKEADAREYTLNATLKPYTGLDWRTLVAINGDGMNAGDHIAMAFRELAENADKIGNLNITPDLLETLTKVKN